eukprot:Sspe_Gene.119787::Locus_116653_Transcript_1_1_Confidence_1.000_Length_663::g.119787::m.119787
MEKVWRLLQPLISPVLREGDDDNERQRKAMIIPMAWLGSVATLILVVFAVLEEAPLGILSTGVCFVVCATLLLYAYCTRSAPPRALGISAFVVGCVAVFGDIWTYGLVDYYTGSVLIIDVLLLCKCDVIYQHCLVGITIMVIIVQSVEQTHGLGIYERIPEWWTGFNRPQKSRANVLPTLLSFRLVVLCGDYLLTSHFSHGMR